VKTLAAPTSGSPVNPKKSDATGVPMKNPGDASGKTDSIMPAMTAEKVSENVSNNRKYRRPNALLRSKEAMNRRRLVPDQ
jgi:hypothetical protein